jgi:hypothetical protein
MLQNKRLKQNLHRIVDSQTAQRSNDGLQVAQLRKQQQAGAVMDDNLPATGSN